MSTPDPVTAAAAAVAMPSAEERNWALFAHLAAFAGCLIPFGSILGPLVVWLIKKDQMPFVNDQGKEALNFQITMAIAMVLSAILILILIGLLLIWAVIVLDVVFTIIAAVKASNGERYRYPISLRLIN